MLNRKWLGLVFMVPMCAQAPLVRARVDPRVELVATVCMLAEVRGFTNCEHPGYLAKVKTHFEPFRDHPAVIEARRLAKERMIFLGAPLSLALHLDDALHLRPDARPGPNMFVQSKEPVMYGGTLDFRWTPELGRNFASLLRDFAEKSRFREFMASQRAFHAVAEERLSRLAQCLDLAWVGKPMGFQLLTSTLVGHNNFGPSLPGGSAAIMGQWCFDSQGPVFDEGALDVMVHESLHPWVNPRVDRWMDLLRPAGEALAKAKAADFERTGYAGLVFNPDILYETLVRSLEVVYAEDHGGAKAGKEMLARHMQDGWTWLPTVVPWMREARRDGRFERAEQATFQDLAELFQRCAR